MRVAWRTARADLWPLLVTMLVVALTVGLSVAVPTALADRADTAVRIGVADANPRADLLVTAPYAAGASDPTAGATDTTGGVDDVARTITDSLPGSVRRVLGPAVAAATSTDLSFSTPGLSTAGVLWMSYLWSGQEPGVRWLQGVAPGRPGPDGAVQLAMSDEVARTLGVRAGDTLQTTKPDRTVVPVLVTGVFAAQDPGDLVWSERPEMLQPRVVGASRAPTTVVGGLLSAASLPAARAALEPAGVTRTFRFAVDPQALDYAGSGALATELAALEASPAVLGAPGPLPSVTSRLDLVLTQARERVSATGSQAMVVLAGLGSAAVLVLLVAAELLARRRAVALHIARARGASLVFVAGRAGAEAAVVVGLGAAVGVALGLLVAPGAVTWLWVIVVVVVGVLAPPAFAMWTATRSEARRVPTDEHHRRAAQRVRTVRRGSWEAALVVLAVAATAVLRRRGVVSMSSPADRLLAAGPFLVAAAGALLLWRAAPVLLGVVLRVARRSRRAGPLLAVARARSTGAALPFVALVVVISLSALCGAIVGTARAGQSDGSWDSVGADALVRPTSPDSSMLAVAGALAEVEGVEAVAVGRVAARSELLGAPGVDAVRVLAIDPVAYGALLARTPFGAAPGLGRLTDASTTAGALPALVAGPLLGSTPSLRWGDVTIDLEPVGEAPALPMGQPDGTPAGPTVVVDRAALAEAVMAASVARAERTSSAPVRPEDVAVDPDTVWVVGPRAASAAQTAAAPSGAQVLAREQWLADRRSDPLNGGLLTLVALVTVVCAGLATVVVVLDAAASAPGRGRSLATARVLGLRRRDAARVAAGELLPLTLVAGVGGILLGVLLAGAITAPLALRLVTGQSADPGVVLPWWAMTPVALLAATVLVVVAVESSARRRERLGQVLRVR